MIQTLIALSTVAAVIAVGAIIISVVVGYEQWWNGLSLNQPLGSTHSYRLRIIDIDRIVVLVRERKFILPHSLVKCFQAFDCKIKLMFSLPILYLLDSSPRRSLYDSLISLTSLAVSFA